MSLVGLAKVWDGSMDALSQAMFKSLNSIDFPFGTGLRRVVIKPNLCYYWDYSTGQTTDPRFVAVLIDLIREKSSSEVDFSVVESDASAMKCRYAFRMLGYEKLSKSHGVRLVNLSEDECETVCAEAGGRSFRLMVPETIQKADLCINIPKIKYAMEGIEITCALKNIFGCNPYPKKFKYHPILEEAIVAINKVMRFDLCIIDGNIVSGIQPRRLGLVMASKDPVAIDAAAAEIAGINPKTIRYIQLAKEEGLGETSFNPKGVSIDHFKNMYPRKNIKRRLMSKAYSLAIRAGLGKRLGLE